MTFLGLAGDADVVVPPGSRVTGGGLSVFGDRRIEVTPGEGPEIRIDGYSLFGDVKVSDPSARTSSREISDDGPRPNPSETRWQPRSMLPADRPATSQG